MNSPRGRVPHGSRPARAGRSLAVWAIAALLLVSGFTALGNWQIKRRIWKLNLIAEVNARVHAAAVPAPGPSRWRGIGSGRDRYRHVRVTGHYLQQDETLVHGTSSMGYGYWVMTPLRTTQGFIVLINRGHIPESLPGTRAFRALPRPKGRLTVTGLLRLTQPKGGFLRQIGRASCRERVSSPV